MGRVYEALKRAAAHADAPPKRTDEDVAPRADNTNGNAQHANGNGAAHTNAPGADPLFARPTAFFNAPDAAHSSASTEHTAQAQVGSALPGDVAARVAGATVDAGGATRHATYTSNEVVTSRAEPHLLAITDPRSPHAEQYHSLPTHTRHAGAQ